MCAFNEVPIIGRPAESGGLEGYRLQFGHTLCGAVCIGSLVGSRSVLLYGQRLYAPTVAVRYGTRVTTNQTACVVGAGY